MLFCPKCGSILKPKKVKSKNILECSCGFKCEQEKVLITECAQTKPHEEIVVVEKEQPANPVVDAECPKCSWAKAEFWEVQTRAADEAATRFFRCTKCRHTWREYE